jgi:hypothetical protein
MGVATGERIEMRMESLAKANAVRFKRLVIKQRVVRGDLSVADVLLDLPAEVQTLAIGEMLQWQRRWGDTRTRQFLGQLCVSETKQTGRLTDRQRQVMAGALIDPTRPVLDVWS